MCLACHGKVALLSSMNFDSSLEIEYIQSAISYHEQHLRISDTGGFFFHNFKRFFDNIKSIIGKFVALTNIGLCYSMLKNPVQVSLKSFMIKKILLKFNSP